MSCASKNCCNVDPLEFQTELSFNSCIKKSTCRSNSLFAVLDLKFFRFCNLVGSVHCIIPYPRLEFPFSLAFSKSCPSTKADPIIAEAWILLYPASNNFLYK